MGMNLIGSRSSYDLCEKAVKSLPNPDPTDFEIEKYEQIGIYLILIVRYPKCINYEGRKILVYKDIMISDIVEQGHIDPHFSESKKFYSPIARFEPTEMGLTMARYFAKSMHS